MWSFVLKMRKIISPRIGRGRPLTVSLPLSLRCRCICRFCPSQCADVWVCGHTCIGNSNSNSSKKNVCPPQPRKNTRTQAGMDISREALQSQRQQHTQTQWGFANKIRGSDAGSISPPSYPSPTFNRPPGESPTQKQDTATNTSASEGSSHGYSGFLS